MTGLNTIENTYWIGAAIRPVARGNRDREVLRHELTEDHRAHSGDDEGDRQRQRSGEAGADSPGLEHRSQQLAQGRFHEIAGEQRGDRDADLRRRQLGGQVRHRPRSVFAPTTPASTA
jgi:hypothetical protein